MSVEVNRESLDYRAGWVEALVCHRAYDQAAKASLDYRTGWAEALLAFGRQLQLQLQLQGARAKKGKVKGLKIASEIASEMHAAIIAKIRGSDKPV